MEWAAILRDLVIGLLIAGRHRGLGPGPLLAGLLHHGHPLAAALWGPVVGPVVALA